MRVETDQCPQCPAQMIRRPTDSVSTQAPATMPSQVATEWWCGCGYRMPSVPTLEDVPNGDPHKLWWVANRQRELAEEEAERRSRRWWRPW